MWKKVVKSLLVSLFLIGLMLINYNYWQSKILTGIFFVFFLAEQIFIWKRIWQHFFSYSKKLLANYLWSFFSVIFLLGTFISWWIVFYHLTGYSYFGIFLLLALFSSLVDWFSFKYRVEKDEKIFSLGLNLKIFNKNFILLIGFLLVFLLTGYFLFKNQSLAVLFSPWQTINQYYLPLFFVLQIFVGYFVFSKYKTQLVILVLVLSSLLLHFYLPVSHELPWGGDVWRHLAMENKIDAGDYILPVLFKTGTNWQEIIKVNLPLVFQNPQKFSYAFTWGLTVLSAKFFNLSLLEANKWLGPVLFSLILPILLYRLGFLLFDDRRKALLLAWLASLPFALQASGSLTLPVNLGLLSFLFVLVLWFEYLKSENKIHKYLALFFAFLMLFNYSLYFILIWVVIVSSVICQLLSGRFQLENIKYRLTKKIIWTVIIFLSFFVIPVIELVSKVSFVPENLNLWQNIKQALGQFSGWFYASAVRPHDILSGNIIFNHTPDYAFVMSIFNGWRWWLIPAMIIIWLLVGLGLTRIYDIRHKIVGLLFSCTLGGYLIGWFVLDGDRLLTRRLDSVLAVLILILLIQGFSYLLSKFQISSAWADKFQIKIIALVIILGISWFITFTYATGPDMRVVSKDESEQALSVLINDRDWEKHCVLADTWVLLPLEAMSSGQIVGGGFPIDYNFGQPEREYLFQEMTSDPRLSVFDLSRKITGAKTCWFVQSTRFLSEDKVKKINSFVGSLPLEKGELLSWRRVWPDTPAVAD